MANGTRVFYSQINAAFSYTNEVVNKDMISFEHLQYRHILCQKEFLIFSLSDLIIGNTQHFFNVKDTATLTIGIVQALVDLQNLCMFNLKLMFFLNNMNCTCAVK